MGRARGYAMSLEFKVSRRPAVPNPARTRPWLKTMGRVKKIPGGGGCSCRVMRKQDISDFVGLFGAFADLVNLRNMIKFESIQI